MKLQIPKTRGGSTSQGKPRIYFTCHPNNFDRCFEDICGDILSRQNCAIYWFPPDEKIDNTEEYEFTLKQMQLVVVPVSKELLTTPNRAMDSDIPFAQKNHIPVLPLMYSSEKLDELLNKRFGDIQYLNKFVSDSTAKSYDSKLTEYLDSVIVGDELAEKVRNAFDAYIFLSYRKVDRIYAQRLMKKIHRLPQYRDIAIWYDEFLVPGENFNDAIKDAFTKCSLFALAVTDNVVAEGNYVHKIEYQKFAKPRQSEDDKFRIIPVEMYDLADKRVDKDVLDIKFDELPELQDEHDEVRLDEELLDALEHIARKENDGSALHRFFIGLAYLKGIDSEVDHNRAFKLIEGSADENCVEAMEKLVSMYRLAEGVERDYNKAIDWQRKLADYWLSLYNADQTDENAKEYLNALAKLMEYLMEARRLDAAVEVGHESSRLCVPLQKTKQWAFSMLMFSYSKLAEIYRIAGKSDLAYSYSQKNAEILRAIIEREPENDDAVRILAVELNSMGRTKMYAGDINTAYKLFEEALPLCEQLDNKLHTLQTRRDVMASNNYLGNIYFMRRDFNNAYRCFSEMHRLGKSILEEEPSVEARRDYGAACLKLATYYINMRQPELALEYMLESESAAKKNADDAQTFEAYKDLNVIYDNIVHFYISMNRIYDARSYALKQIKTAEKLETISSCLESKVAMREAYDSMSRICAGLGDRNDGILYGQKQIEVARNVIDIQPIAEQKNALATALFNYGVAANDWSSFKEAHSIWKQLREQHPEVPEYEQYMRLAKQKMSMCSRW